MSDFKLFWYHWRHFLSIENKILETFKYVELSENNYSTYSIEFQQIILLSASEMESVLKQICLELDSNFKLESGIGKCSNFIKTKDLTLFNKLNNSSVHIDLPGYPNLVLKPFLVTRTEDPNGIKSDWQVVYENLKHYREEGTFKKAKLKYALDSLAALFSVLLIFLEVLQKTNSLIIDWQEYHHIMPKLFVFNAIQPIISGGTY
ncbi:hypothetical protein H6G80_31705 [Nostoc sp. FACHB-87]|uniref:hypothetical protein n=1 Tax=Nostocaceae TaxID=1162 RepID=UPI0016852A89|nr:MULTISPECIES: hypothetical protein [Nostocaceae]MBD2458617.1 hypothetical protein [Nostoc sp. FACHB-87]MBD2479690.1 hypothetical protein [Anabaena sp. FACHB-83]